MAVFGARARVRELEAELDSSEKERVEAQTALTELEAQHRELTSKYESLRENQEATGALSVLELEERQRSLTAEIERVSAEDEATRAARRAESEEAISRASRQLEQLQASVVVTEELQILQEVGIYEYKHPLDDAVAYKAKLERIRDQIKVMARKDGGAILAASGWTVNNSAAQGRTMIRDYSKLMLRAYNAEADNLVRGLKPYKLASAIDRLNKVAVTIRKLGKTMSIRVSDVYHGLRITELELTADYLEKVAEEKERDREEKARLREERQAQKEMERERAKLEKEHRHYENALAALEQKGDLEAVGRMRADLERVERAIEDVDYRAANVRAGYVYVISNVGSFGPEIVKIGMTRRLDPKDRVRELSDASVPFNFDVHALFFAPDAVGIEAELHRRLADRRINRVNMRREFFRATPLEVKEELLQVAGDLLEFEETAEAIEYHQSLNQVETVPAATAEH